MTSKGVIAGNTPRGEGLITKNGFNAYSILVNPLPRMVAGPGAVSTVGKEVLALGRKYAMIVTDPGLTKAGLTGQLVTALKSTGVEVDVYDQVSANPTFQNVRDGIDVLLKRPINETTIVSLGGGSSMDCAKAISVIGSDGTRGSDGKYDIRSYCRYPVLGTDDKIEPSSMVPAVLPQKPGVPIIAIPTTSGTASETNGGAVITDSDAQIPRKLIFSDGSAQAKVNILDPELTLGLPPYPTATCGMDALCHALEAFTSLRQNPYSDSIAIGVIAEVAEWLPKLLDNLSNLEARSRIQLASHMAGAAFGIAGLGICHAVGHPLSAVLHQAHGQTLATMLPHIMEFNLPARAEKYARVAEAFGVFDKSKSTEDNARMAIDAVAKLSIRVGTARSIEMMGGDASLIPELVEQSMTDTSMRHNAIQPTRSQLTEIFKKALRNPILYPEKSTSQKKLVKVGTSSSSKL